MQNIEHIKYKKGKLVYFRPRKYEKTMIMIILMILIVVKTD